MKPVLSLTVCLLLGAGLLRAQVLSHESAFLELAALEAEVRELAAGLQFTEGPVWIEGQAGQPGYLLFSDIDADRIYRWAEGDSLRPWREPSGKSNGLLIGPDGRLLACEHWNRRVSAGSLDRPQQTVTICDSYQGKKLNSPNDIAIGPEGSLWFTDPSYGLEERPQDLPGCYVFRLAPGAKAPRVMVADFDRPNGIVFSPDKGTLYIADSGRPHHVRAFRVEGDSLGEGRVFATISPGGPDGMCVDRQGNLYVTAGDGVQVFTPEGKLIGRILTPQTPANCCFGGDDRRTLFMTARTGLYAVRLKTAGLP